MTRSQPRCGLLPAAKKSGCRACPEYNSCGKIGCRMADEAAGLIEMQRREVGYVYAMRRVPDEEEKNDG